MKFLTIPIPRIIKQTLLGALLEFGPVVIFLLSFEFFHVYKATIVLMVTTIISTFVTFRMQKRLPYVALYVALLTSIFGYITLTLHQPKFIQMRDTLYDTTCALTLIVGLMINVPFLKLAFHQVLPMTTRSWTRLTYAWIGFFLSIAIANEYVRRTMSLHDWFTFKSYMVIITAIFGGAVVYFLYEEGKRGH
jgi:intracellular septation protein